jgi:endonuclease YncB( thermonuclease family)
MTTSIFVMLMPAIVTNCVAIDGDTLRCNRERIRLIGIDAPELPGHCRRGRHCVAGDPIASTKSLSSVATGRLKIRRFGEDHYGRTLALLSGKMGDLSCWQLKQKMAFYKRNWDRAKLVEKCAGVS